jgi:cell cycle sensor histidine kinase DivJ
LTAFLKLNALASALTHKSVCDPVEVLRHRIFIGARLALGVGALVASIVWLAGKGAPTPVEALAIAFAFAPLLCIFIVSRTGDLPAAAGMGLVGLIGLSLSLAFANPAFAPFALALLVLSPAEAAIAGSSRLTIAAAMAAASALLVGWQMSLGFTSGLGWFALLFLGLAFVSAASLGALLMQRLVRTIADGRAGRHDALVQTLGDCVLEMDRSGAVLRAGPGGAESLDLSARELMGRGLFERIHIGDRPAFLKAVSDAAIGAVNVCASVRLRVGAQRDCAPSFGRAEIRVRRIEASQHPVASPHHVIGIVRDVTARFEHEAVLAQARSQAESTNLWKDRFLANVSHELRTPLNAIIGFSEILASEKLAPVDPVRSREYASIINESGHHLLSVVNSILDVSKMEAGSFTLSPEALDLAPLVDQSCDILRLKAEDSGVVLIRDLPVDLPEIVADRRALKQILINLMSNAVKFTPANGRVLVRIRPEGASLAISVTDTGVGVCVRDLARLGDPFFQAEGDYDRRYEGTGLGLSVVRGLVGLHGGAISLESAPGEGTRVIVKLPLDFRTLPEANRTAQARIETCARGPAGVLAGGAARLRGDSLMTDSFMRDEKVIKIA